ncbi:hypothetical protein [Rasiella sp. SM2506]|uniref:hypothetical protein n=1 Tax=Rasiella sp. SM2506 TaxID=3423914 RepID=UPI003D7A54BD
MFTNEDSSNRDAARNIPVFLKAEEIRILVLRIVQAVENTDITFKGDHASIQKEWIQSSLDHLMQNATVIPAKISGAEAVEMYDLKMENATIIRKAAKELITDARSLQINGYKETEYLDLLRNEIEIFRVVFAEWVKTFDPFNYSIDRWGLFNPPGVNYNDHDPEDDIPFNPLEYLDTSFYLYDDEDLDEDESDEDDDENMK